MHKSILHAFIFDTYRLLSTYFDRRGGSRPSGAAASTFVDSIVAAARESDGGQFIDVKRSFRANRTDELTQVTDSFSFPRY
jgi:hypothetical protein